MLAALLYSLFWVVSAQACGSVILVSNNSHFAIVHRIEASLFGKLTTKPKLIHLLSENLHEKAATQQLSEACLIVTIGSESLRQILNIKTQTPILSVLSRRAIFHHLLKTHQRTLNDPSHPISAIYLDQPLERQLNLISCLFKHRPPKQVGVILGTESLYHQESLQKSAPRFPFHLNTGRDGASVLKHPAQGITY
ncbi:MAG TPA: hypothetical protein PLD88_04150, partial [Candidatus Berkiella sp.]|nr:hypothetical protein [Candidatus Berkiella sp.]